MCPQAPRSSPEYSHKAGLQTVITEKPLQIGPVIHSASRGLLQWAELHVGLRVGRGRETERPRRRPSSCSVLDEGWKLLVALHPLLRRDRRRHRAKVAQESFGRSSIVRPPVLSLFVRPIVRSFVRSFMVCSSICSIVRSFVRSFVQIIFFLPLCCRNSDRSFVRSFDRSSFVHSSYSS
jgi:hypothetical protein